MCSLKQSSGQVAGAGETIERVSVGGAEWTSRALVSERHLFILFLRFLWCKRSYDADHARVSAGVNSPSLSTLSFSASVRGEARTAQA